MTSIPDDSSPSIYEKWVLKDYQLVYGIFKENKFEEEENRKWQVMKYNHSTQTMLQTQDKKAW